MEEGTHWKCDVALGVENSCQNKVFQQSYYVWKDFKI
jgi:hypothetical protein